MARPPIVLICGKAQSGKDTLADSFIERMAAEKSVNKARFFIPAQKFYLAGKLKDLVHEVLGVPREQLYGTNEEKNKPTHIRRIALNQFCSDIGTDGFATGRELLQVVGSNVFRFLDEDCWVRCLYHELMKDFSSDWCPLGLAIIGDTRFPSEINYFVTNRIPIKVIHLKRNTLNMNHISETALDDFNWENPLIEYHAIDNTSMTVEEKNEIGYNIMKNWVVAPV